MKAFYIFSLFLLFYSNCYSQTQKIDTEITALNIALEKKDYDLALDIINKPIFKKDELDSYHTTKAIIYQEKGDTLKAIENYKLALNYNPNDTITHTLLGQISFEHGDYESAIVNYSNAISLEGDNPDFLRTRALIYLYLNSYRLALEDLQSSILIQSDQATDYYYAGLCQNELNNFSTALSHFNTCKALGGNIPELFYQKGISLYEIGENEKAKTEWIKAKNMGLKEAIIALESLKK